MYSEDGQYVMICCDFSAGIIIQTRFMLKKKLHSAITVVTEIEFSFIYLYPIGQKFNYNIFNYLLLYVNLISKC